MSLKETSATKKAFGTKGTWPNKKNTCFEDEELVSEAHACGQPACVLTKDFFAHLTNERIWYIYFFTKMECP